MQEQLLLKIALSTAVIGIIVLFFLPPTPPAQIRGEVAWSNGTLTKLVVYEEIWVEHDAYTEVPIQGCVEFSARQSLNGYTNARVLGVRPPSSQNCQ